MDYVSDSLLVFEGKPGVEGSVGEPLHKQEGMNKLLSLLNITYRRDQETGRARINKPGSLLDREQRKKKQYYVV